MTYRLPLRVRQRLARNKRERYWRDPAYRLQRINEAREKRGLTPVGDLAAVKHRGPLVAQ